MSALTDRHHLGGIAGEDRHAVVWMSARDEVSALVAGYLVRIDECGPTGLRILAEGVPPAVVAALLRELRIGHLQDYDVAVMFSDWRLRALAPADAPRSPLGTFLSVRVEY
jgi:hypothetical protein